MIYNVSSASEHCILNQRWPRLSSAEIRTIAQYMQQKVKQTNCESVMSTMSISPGSLQFCRIHWQLGASSVLHKPNDSPVSWSRSFCSCETCPYRSAPNDTSPRIYAPFTIWEICWEKVLYHKKNKQFLRRKFLRSDHRVRTGVPASQNHPEERHAVGTGCLTKQLTHINWHNFVTLNAFLILFQI